MKAVLKREIRSYFTSPIGYVCIAVLLALFGYWYYIVMLAGSSSNIPYVYSYMLSYCMMIIPILTMKTISDDQKNKTDQALLTAPVSVLSIVMGKFLAAFFVFLLRLPVRCFLRWRLAFLGRRTGRKFWATMSVHCCMAAL